VIRIVDEDRLIEALERSVRAGDATAFRRWLRRQPTTPDLVSAGTAARILGVPHSHVARLGREGVLRPIPVEGTASTYLRAEVKDAATRRTRERKAR
jgi:hypothetical protein